MNIRNIIIDFGGIIVDLDKQAALDAFEALHFNARPYIDKYVQQGIFSGLELGTTSPEEFYDYVCQQASCPIPHQQICQAWNSMLTAIPPHRLSHIARLRQQGFRTYLLSNTNSIHWQHTLQHLLPRHGEEFTQAFHHLFLSFEMHLAKPAPQAFQYVLDHAGIQAQESLFIDDSATNCQSAQALGIHTFHSVTPDDWIDHTHLLSPMP